MISRSLFAISALALSTSALAQDWQAGEAALSEALDVPGFSGAIVAMRDGEVIFEAYRGLANQETGREIDAETSFNIASVGKFFTATGFVLASQQAGLDPYEIMLADVFDDAPGLFSDDITPVHLMAHASNATSFISDSPSAIEAMANARANEDVFQLTLAAQASPIGINTEGLAYSNSGYILLGETIERLSGESYEGFLQANIFGPAGVEPLFARQEEAEELNLALPYLPEGYDPEAGPRRRDPNAAIPSEYPVLAESELGNMISSAAGGLYMRPVDLARAGDAILSGAIIPQDRLEWMCTSVVERGSRIFGRGCGGRDEGEGRRRWGHNGGAPGINAELALYPDQGLTVIIVSNHQMRASPVLNTFEAAYFGPTGERQSGGYVIRE